MSAITFKQSRHQFSHQVHSFLLHSQITYHTAYLDTRRHANILNKSKHTQVCKHLNARKHPCNDISRVFSCLRILMFPKLKFIFQFIFHTHIWTHRQCFRRLQIQEPEDLFLFLNIVNDMFYFNFLPWKSILKQSHQYQNSRKPVPVIKYQAHWICAENIPPRSTKITNIFEYHPRRRAHRPVLNVSSGLSVVEISKK